MQAMPTLLTLTNDDLFLLDLLLSITTSIRAERGTLMRDGRMIPPPPETEGAVQLGMGVGGAGVSKMPKNTNHTNWTR